MGIYRHLAARDFINFAARLYMFEKFLNCDISVRFHFLGSREMQIISWSFVGLVSEPFSVKSNDVGHFY